MTSRARWPHALFALHCLATLYCVAGPGYRQWGSAPRPFVLGLPWPIVWVLVWLALTLVALFAYWRWYERGASGDE